MSRTRWVLIASFAGVIGAGAWFADQQFALTSPYRGVAMARFDWWRGHRELKLYRLPARTRPDFASLLQSRYGVQAREVASCVVSPSLVAYANSYNQFVTDRLHEEYGRDVILEVANEVESRESRPERAEQPGGVQK